MSCKRLAHAHVAQMADALHTMGREQPSVVLCPSRHVQRPAEQNQRIRKAGMHAGKRNISAGEGFAKLLLPISFEKARNSDQAKPRSWKYRSAPQEVTFAWILLPEGASILTKVRGASVIT